MNKITLKEHEENNNSSRIRKFLENSIEILCNNIWRKYLQEIISL